MSRSTLALCLIGAVFLTGCEKTAPITTTTVEGKVRRTNSSSEEVRVWRDPETGCQYLLWERKQRGAMTPRLTPDGRPLCKP